MHTASHVLSGCIIAISSLLPISGCAATTPPIPVASAAPVNMSSLNFAEMWQPGWQCGQEAPVSKALVQSLLDKHALYGYALNDVPLPILLGKNPAQPGSILFTERQGKWHAWPIAEGGDVLAAYSTPAFNRVMLFATWGRQGPGNDYVLLHGKHQLGEFGCSVIHLPAELNRPDWGNQYPAIQAFNMDAEGRGTLLTAANSPKGRASTTRWYQYASPDWGRSWGEAAPVASVPAKKAGIFQPLREISPPTWFVRHLLASSN